MNTFCKLPFAALLFLTSQDCLADNTSKKAAIIDISDDTRPFMKQLSNSGAAVIGRYLGRCAQWKGKRIIENGSPADKDSEIAQLVATGFGLLSIYQYNSNSPLKFIGRNKDGRPLPGGDCTTSNLSNSRQPVRSPEDEGSLDAHAAVDQAEALKQPKHSAIYFGVDFPITAGSTDVENMRRYFSTVHKILTENGYSVGVYGSGLANETIRADRNASFFWISASRSFEKSTHFHNSKEWTLFQDTIDLDWFGKRGANGACLKGLGVETDIQNIIDDNYAGFWRPGSLFKIDRQRVEAILNSSRFVCSGHGLLFAKRSGSERPSGEICRDGKAVGRATKIDYAQSVRIGDVFPDRTEIDVDNDGNYDGWIETGALTHDYFSKPNWIRETVKRGDAKCPPAD